MGHGLGACDRSHAAVPAASWFRAVYRRQRSLARAALASNDARELAIASARLRDGRDGLARVIPCRIVVLEEPTSWRRSRDRHDCLADCRLRSTLRLLDRQINAIERRRLELAALSRVALP